MIPYGKQDISDDDMEAVARVLRSDFLTQGPIVPQFEAALAEICGAAYGVAVNSATSALHIAVASLGLGEGDLMWTSPITFVASANCGRYCGADVDFVDIDPETFNMCPQALAAKLERAIASGRLPKVIVPVHMGGQSAAMREIADLCRPHGIRIVEDASHAVGGSYEDSPVGSCQYSDITIFSFHPVKIVTTAEGGMAMTNDAALAGKMSRLRSHGITRDEGEMTHASDGPWYYQQIELGLNYRMTELQAALGLSQLKRLAAFVDRRNALADRYDRLLTDLPLRLPGRQAATRSAFHLYIIRLDDPDQHSTVFENLRARGIGVNLHYIPVHLQPYYRQFGFGPGDFPAAEDYYARAISIPLYAGLTDADQDVVVAALTDILTSEPT
ncbi:UDP-4-amino-4, 6-dideoxy-N-acetyl-beta-L-altrosamine transaminase (plasmid) [Pseudosulfitobacter pseudonitzschiae]|uniref:UDP-4-amino-4, 6-dideoxy-N-acetyl-beta-L-altrosamine transaminase n=1 Tax=Pseudosulfitobacter pseudonitzschiae TaxID=1402135 RepID=A0A221K6I8_9RHOB|nr:MULTISPECIES: UDP-4-amino-4,6-dideoxy-N-acetyl-beta-L-altrosamine transaminase [Roseobacteraceae]ASM74622.1 UDP-4-amino-4, 6-dideoxy-N-acetyl-beta-L-altrosamine transaminase [Pseudosulfitobacter pseudonitzschiae]